MSRLLVESYLADLFENCQYPEGIKMFNYKKHLGVCLNNAVWDIDNGIVMRLGEGKIVTHAIRGFKALN